MEMLLSFCIVILLAVIAFAGVELVNLQFLFGVIIPYAAFAVFVIGFINRVIQWGRSPVPFHIPTTCGQQKSLPWIKYSKLDNPSGTMGVIGRMALEVFFFRSLFRNLKTGLKGGDIKYAGTKWLWLGGLIFHYSFFIVLVRHLRFFTNPVPSFVGYLDFLDGYFKSGAPHLLITGWVLLIAVIYLFLRRAFIPSVRYISLTADYFPLFLIMGIALSGVIMRYYIKVDIVHVKELTMGLVTFSPVVPQGIGSIFFIHLFFICTLFAYFPFSKLMHLGGVFLSPTRNLANNSRMRRHINPWNYDVKVHTYEAYEDEFREKMKSVGLPVEKE